MAENSVHEGKTIENAYPPHYAKGESARHHKAGKKTLLLFETGRKETHQTSISPETQPQESASRTPRRPKVVNHGKTQDPRVYCLDGKKNLRWKSLVSNHRN